MDYMFIIRGELNETENYNFIFINKGNEHMKDKLNWKECMKRKCEQCKYYDRCFKEERKIENEKNKIFSKCSR